MRRFKEAKAIWLDDSGLQENRNNFAGFYTHLSMEKDEPVVIALTARSYYRLYVNGEMIANGPARTAEHYGRIDEIQAILPKECDLAIEVVAYGKTPKYCNDCTLEPGILIAEVTTEDGSVLSATGKIDWSCQELNLRRGLVETMSHSRGIVEYYDLDQESFAWRRQKGERVPVLVEEDIRYLKRRAPYPNYHKTAVRQFLSVGDMVAREHGMAESNIELARMMNPDWYQLIPEENQFLEGLLREEDGPFTGTYELGQGEITVRNGKKPAGILWETKENLVGFLSFHIEVEKDCVLDILHSDHLSIKGTLEGNTYATRYCLAPGSYDLMPFEPKLIRYLKFIVRTKGSVRISDIVIRDDSYPDENATFFSCSDGDLNRIYEAARKTLTLNTLDIFMDCPERERGGWLCDSYFTSRSAWHMYGDARVEQDFMENFLLTDPDCMWNGFFPEVYPGVHRDPQDVGIRNWSFWLILELCDYYERTGDRSLFERYEARIDRFIEGVLSLRGESGLLENLDVAFVDWSLSNDANALGPISIPNNCLAVYMLEQLALVYGKTKLRDVANEMRLAIEGIEEGIFYGKGDGASWDSKEKRLSRNSLQTESGIALELWSGFHGKETPYVQQFVETMGYQPRYVADPKIGKSNLFIGLMIRFGMLEKLGQIDTLVKEMKALYLEQLRIGTGTLFEGVAERSGCHGFNSYAGTLLSKHVLGLGTPMEQTKEIIISPHPGELNWASGSVATSDGPVLLRWTSDMYSHELELTIHYPKNWKMVYEWPVELKGWKIRVNGE